MQSYVCYNGACDEEELASSEQERVYKDLSGYKRSDEERYETKDDDTVYYHMTMMMMVMMMVGKACDS